MHSVKSLLSRGTCSNLSCSGLFSQSHYQLPSVLSSSVLHTCETRFKFQTDTDMVHQMVTYGHTAYPSRPNDPRVPSNPNFGVTHLHRPKLANQPSAHSDAGAKNPKTDSISKAMKVYLERAKKHNEFMQEQESEFDMGRRHLANMMGISEATMSQADINLAIQYLMPSGLFDPRARPRMRPPSEIYPTIKEAQFQPDGRPFHSHFFTGKSNFYQACFDIEEEENRLREYQESQQAQGITNAPEDAKIDFGATTWLTHQEMKQMFLEKVETKRYEAFIAALTRLSEHPYSKLSSAFINKFRKHFKTAAEMMEILPLKLDEDGRPYMDSIGIRKHCIAHVTVRGNGTGLVNINGKDILYFANIQDREQIMTPLKFTGMLFKVDIEAKTMHEEMAHEWSEDAPAFPQKYIRQQGPADPPEKFIRPLGHSAQAGAIRYGISLALKSFLDRETVEKMRLVGLLTKDFRMRERKKWGQEGARRKYTWKKR